LGTAVGAAITAYGLGWMFLETSGVVGSYRTSSLLTLISTLVLIISFLFLSRCQHAAAVCYRVQDGNIELRLVRTTGGRWTFPKGRIQRGEAGSDAAKREAFEEAGVNGTIEKTRFAVYLHQKREFKKREVEIQRIAAYLLHVESASDPIEKGREPVWRSPNEAIADLAYDREFKYAEELRQVVNLACERI
jgi:8-oxo-dGTP pyrophosphatase MutT (NUDIX family)